MQHILKFGMSGYELFTVQIDITDNMPILFSYEI